MITAIIIAILVLFLFLYSFRVVFEISLKNFDFYARISLKLPFEKVIFDSRKKDKRKIKETKTEKKGNKIKLETLKMLKDPAFTVISEVCKILKKHCRIIKVKTTAKAALDDPMENGIAYGIISGVLNVISLTLKETLGAKKVELDIISDFDSGEGLIFTSLGTLRVRPITLIFTVLFSRKLIKEIKNITDILKREETDNG